MILMDDYDFLLSPLTQPALKRPLFLPQMVLDLDFFYISLKTRSSAKAPPPSGAFAPGSPLLRTQMNEHLLDAAPVPSLQRYCDAFLPLYHQ